MNQTEIEAFLDYRKIPFETKSVANGTQLKISTGESVVIYKTGNVLVQGKATPLHEELQRWKETGESPMTDGDVTHPLPSPDGNRNIFVVYGHDADAKDGLDLALRKMGLTPIILGNAPAEGKTIIEKLERYLSVNGDVGYACVLLTPDDEGYKRGADEAPQGRARQNVILELGMVLAKLGRDRVAILYQKGVERPSDIQGLVYIPFVNKIREAIPSLYKELEHAGYSLNSEALS